jgi:hypothetical protein
MHVARTLNGRYQKCPRCPSPAACRSRTSSSRCQAHTSAAQQRSTSQIPTQMQLLWTIQARSRNRKPQKGSHNTGGISCTYSVRLCEAGRHHLSSLHKKELEESADVWTGSAPASSCRQRGSGGGSGSQRCWRQTCCWGRSPGTGPRAPCSLHSHKNTPQKILFTGGLCS